MKNIKMTKLSTKILKEIRPLFMMAYEMGLKDGTTIGSLGWKKWKNKKKEEEVDIFEVAMSQEEQMEKDNTEPDKEIDLLDLGKDITNGIIGIFKKKKETKKGEEKTTDKNLEELIKQEIKKSCEELIELTSKIKDQRTLNKTWAKLLGLKEETEKEAKKGEKQ